METVNGNCLINNIYIPKKVINIYISYTRTPWLRNLNLDFTLNNCLFGSVKLTMLIQTKTKMVVSTYDLIFVQNFYLQMEAWEKMTLFLELV